MKRVSPALLLIALAAAAPPPRAMAAGADGAGNRMAAFVSVTPPHSAEDRDPFARHCTADRTASRRWCARLVRGEAGAPWQLEFVRGAAPARRFAIAAPEDESTELRIWPHIVIERDGAVILGVERTKSQVFTDKEWDVGRLVLVRAGPEPAALRQVLEVPLLAYIDENVCLHPGDVRRRFGSCWERLDFRTTLALDPATRAGPPHFLFAARARTWPAHGVLERELDRQLRLRRSDIRWAVDPECTYRRRVAWQARQGIYLPDGPFPRCPDYFGF